MSGPPQSPQVRPAKAEDLAACAEIINDVIDEMPWLPRVKSRGDIAALFEPGLLARRKVFVAEIGGQIEGYMTVNEAGEIPALYLRPLARRRGLGAALLAKAKALFPAGLSLRVFEPNLGARRFYAREGFTEDPSGRENENENEEGVPTLLLRWKGKP